MSASPREGAAYARCLRLLLGVRGLATPEDVGFAREFHGAALHLSSGTEGAWLEVDGLTGAPVCTVDRNLPKPEREFLVLSLLGAYALVDAPEGPDYWSRLDHGAEVGDAFARAFIHGEPLCDSGSNP